MNNDSLIIYGIGIGYATARAYDGEWGFAAFVLAATIAWVQFVLPMIRSQR